MTAMRFEDAVGPVAGVRPQSAPQSVANLAARLLTKWQRRARDRSQLAALDDRMIAAIGISPAEAGLNYCHMLALARFAVLGAVFLSGAGIAANADPLRPANPGAVGANAAVSS